MAVVTWGQGIDKSYPYVQWNLREFFKGALKTWRKVYTVVYIITQKLSGK